MWLIHHFPNIFHLFGGGGSNTNPTPGVARTPTIEGRSMTPAEIIAASGAASLLPTKPPARTPSTTQKVIGDAAQIAPLIPILMRLFGSDASANANNPANAALTAMLPQLTSSLSSLLENDAARRKMSDPLYQAVLQGAMGGLPVWMRAGVSPIQAIAAATTPPAPPAGSRPRPPEIPSSGTAVPRG